MFPAGTPLTKDFSAASPCKIAAQFDWRLKGNHLTKNGCSFSTPTDRFTQLGPVRDNAGDLGVYNIYHNAMHEQILTP